MISEKDKSTLFPECWSDDERMNVLFAPFRPKSVNPENYVSKLNFWKNMIKRYCDYKGCAQFCKTELLLNFQRSERSPYGLDHVLDDMNLNKEIKTLVKFNEDIEDGWSIWALKLFVKKPIIWGMQRIGIGMVNQNNIEYIFMDVLQRQSSELLGDLHKLNKTIIRYDELNSLDNLNYEGKNLCLRYLHFLKRIHIEYKTLQNGTKVFNVIKIPKADQIASPLTDFEWTLLNLKITQKILDKCIEDLHIEIKSCEESVRNYIREGKKPLAKANLRKKHQIEKNLEKRMIAHDNIHSLINSLEDTEHNGIVLNAIKMGSDTLKALFKKSDLDLDNVDKIILEVKETLDINEDIQNAVSETIVNDLIDDSALEDELSKLLSENVDKVPITEEKVKEEKEKENVINEKELLERLERLNVDNSLTKNDATMSIYLP